MNTLREAVADYLETRRALGAKLEAAGSVLCSFVSFLEHKNCAYVTTALAVEWAKQSSSTKLQEKTWAQRLGSVRQFAKYRITADPRTEIPPYGFLPYPPAPRKIKVTSSNQLPRKRQSSFPCTSPIREAVTDYLALR